MNECFNCLKRAEFIYKDTARRIIDSPRNKTQMLNMLEQTPTVEIIRCKDCKHNYSWFGCPMSHLSERQKPDTAWCWKGERKDDKR